MVSIKVMLPRGTASKMPAVDPGAAGSALDETRTSVRDFGAVNPPPSVSRMSLARQVTASQAIDRTDISRMRLFYLFGVICPAGAILASLHFGGDPVRRSEFWAGAAVVVVCNATLFLLTRRIERHRSILVTALWLLANVCFVPTLAYFGPFCSALMVNVLFVVFSLCQRRGVAIATLVINMGGQFLTALPILLGWSLDRSINASPGMTRNELWSTEGLVLGAMFGGFMLGRWSHAVHARAFAELEQALRAVGDKEQALAEVADAARRVNRANEGRWSGQPMGSFTLGLVLGRGGMGDVYEAVRRDGTTAAIKLLNAQSTERPGMVERFHREMSIVARLESPHIVRVYELSDPGAPVPYIAMERLHGTDLASRLQLGSRIPSDEVAVMLEQVARGLEAARRAGVVHRDLKPHNLFFHAGTTWKILDFGVSKLVDSEGTLTGDGMVGTPQYMAPEQVLGGEVSHRADVYSLGAVAYRCLTGRTLFQGRDLAELVYRVVHTPPFRPSELGRVSRAVEDVLAIALAKDPRRRFPSALAFAQAFLSARAGVPVALEPPPNAWRSWRPAPPPVPGRPSVEMKVAAI